MTALDATVLVVAKSPRPGRVKTRLCPPCTPDQAARIAAAALADTLATVAALPVRRHVLVIDGPVPASVPGTFAVRRQVNGSLGERLAAALAAVDGPAFLVGMDTPQLGVSDLEHALAALAAPMCDAVLGLALDGGWWGLGVTRHVRGLFEGVPMSSPHTGARQLARLRSTGLCTTLLREMRDVDEFDDAGGRGDAPWFPLRRFGRCCGALLRAGAARVVMQAVLRARSGALVANGRTWTGPTAPADDRVLEHVDGPVLDVGCGPGRHVLALARRGIVTLGIDVSLPALALARRRNAPVLERSIFARVPAAGRWGTALLLDGNVGIGGCPATLLERVAELLRPGGRIVVELAPPGAGHAGVEQVRFEVDGVAGPWFDWAHVDLEVLVSLACARGLSVRDRWCDDGRWFAWLT